MTGLMQWRVGEDALPQIGTIAEAAHWLRINALDLTLILPSGPAILERCLISGLSPSMAHETCVRNIMALLALQRDFPNRIDIVAEPQEAKPGLHALVAALLWRADTEVQGLAARLFRDNPSAPGMADIDQLYALAAAQSAEPALQAELGALRAEVQRARHEAEVEKMAHALLQDQLIALQGLAESYVLALDEARAITTPAS